LSGGTLTSLGATVRIEPLDATLGATIGGVSLSSLSGAEWAEIERAFTEHGVLVFGGQHLTDDEQTRFGKRFGELEFLRPDGNGTVPISNAERDGSTRSTDDPIVHTLLGNQGWHTDSSYMPLAAKASMLTAKIVPSSGGQTGWADMRAAYEALDDAMRERIADLSAHHSLVHSQAKVGFGPQPGGYGYDVETPPLRPLVKVHPDTGRKSLFIGRHAYGVPGLDDGESEALLSELLEFACRSPRVIEHDWQPGDLVIWDNRCVLHRARPYDMTQVRVMRHTRVAGSQTEMALNAP
jgi:alpha-ketoglutarate-dependent taurine dioxygenase